MAPFQHEAVTGPAPGADTVRRWSLPAFKIISFLCAVIWLWATPADILAREDTMQTRLRRHVHSLASVIGERNFQRYAALQEAADYIVKTFEEYGYSPSRQSYDLNGRPYHNLIAQRPGTGPLADEIIVIGAHYDSLLGTRGADDNASGVAAVLELSRRFAAETPPRTVTFVAFTNEEPPLFKTEAMGSRHFARRAREKGEKIAAMLSLEMIGYFNAERHSQRYPPGFSWFYPDTADFIAVVGNLSSRSLVREVQRTFQAEVTLNMESLSTFAFIPGVDWSDQWSFWKEGYPAVMITDTALYRNPYYHTPADTIETLDFDRMAQVVEGLDAAIRSLAGFSQAD